MNRDYFTNKDKLLPTKQLPLSLFELAKSRGASAQKLLSGTGIFEDDFACDRRVSVHQMLRLIQNAQRLSEGNDLGFQFGRSLISNMPKDLENALLSAKNFYECLNICTVLKPQLFPFISGYAYKANDNVTLTLFDPVGLQKQQRFVQEASCAALVGLAQHCLGRRLKFAFSLPYSLPSYIYEYEVNLGARLQFSSSLFIIQMSKADAFAPFPNKNLKVKHYAMQHLLNSRTFRSSLIEKIRILLRNSPNAGLPDVANYFSISPASLKRLLKDHNMSFQMIHDDLRRQEALYYLQIQKWKNEATASKMHFTDLNNFRKAVKRLTGMTPSELRSF